MKKLLLFACLAAAACSSTYDFDPFTVS